MSDAILSKIRKLLAKAEDPACTPAEAEALTAKATELMAKYGIDAAIANARATVGPPVVGDRRISIPSPYSRPKSTLLFQICKAFGVQFIRTPGGAGEEKVVAHMFGAAADLDRAEMLFTSLLVQQARELGRAQAPYDGIKAWKRAWMLEYAWEIGRLLTARENAARAQASAEQPAGDGPSVELVLVDLKTQIDRRFREAYPKIRQTPIRLNADGSGGKRAARRADLGGTRVGRARGEIGS